MHQPQTNAPISLPSQFALSGTPTTINGNTVANNFGAAFLMPILASDCPRKLSTKVVVLLAPAWTSSPSP